MQIVHQSAIFSHCLLLPAPAPRLMLAAPPARLALPAPRVAGLIPANVSYTIDQFPLDLGPFRSIEEMDDELAPLMNSIAAKFDLLRDLYARRERRQ